MLDIQHLGSLPPAAARTRQLPACRPPHGNGSPAVAPQTGAVRTRLPAWSARIVFLLGLLNIASGTLRGHARLLNWSQDYLAPFGAASMSIISIGIGFGLLMMARGLRQRKNRAWLATVTLLSAAIVVHLIRGSEPVQTLVSGAVVAALLITRRHFIGRADPASRRSIPLVLLAMLGASWTLGTVAVVTDRDDLVTPWTTGQLLEHTLVGMVGIPGQLHFVNSGATTETAIILIGLGLLAAGITVVAFLHSSGGPVPATPEDRRRLRHLLQAAGESDSLGYFATRDDKSYTFSRSGKAAVAYRVVRGVCLAAGDPVGDVEAWPGAIEEWLRLTGERAWTPAVLGASETGARVYQRLGFDALEIGDEAIVEITDFTLEGRSMRTVRQAVNRARRAGYVIHLDQVRNLDQSQISQAQQVSAKWRRADEHERGFSMALSRFGSPADPECILVQARAKNGDLAVVLQLVPWGTVGWSLDLMRRHPAVENGVMELVIAEVLEAARQRGIARVSLNFAVFRSSLARGERIGAGPILRLWFRALLVMSRRWQIDSLYRANAKFRPSWEPRFLCFLLARDLGTISWAALHAEGFLSIPHFAPFGMHPGAASRNEGP